VSRISYSEEEDYPGQFNLWQANLMRSVRGRAGQAALRELKTALDAMPEKRLIEGHLVKDGEVCTVGAFALGKVMSKGKAREEALAELEAEYGGLESCDTCFHYAKSHQPDEPCSECVEWRDNPDGLSRARQNSVGRGTDYYANWKPCSVFVDNSYDDEDEEGITEEAAVRLGMPRMVAWKLVELNDEIWSGHTFTPEKRYQLVYDWVERSLREQAVPA
jgi:hypothetical protein